MQHNTDPRGHDNASEVERGAYNQAFSELGLEWYWDSRTYESLKTCAGDKDCVQAYIEATCRTCSRPTTAAFSPPPSRACGAA